jgi:O-antigen ligase
MNMPLAKRISGYFTSEPARRRLELTVAALLFAYPVVLLSIRGGMSTCFTVLVVLSCLYLSTMRPASAGVLFDARATAYAAAMSSMVLATALSAVVHDRASLSILDGPSRLLLAIPIYLMLREMPLRVLTISQYGFPLGAIAAAGFVLFYPPNWSESRAGTYFANVIHFGDLALVLGLLSILSLHWCREDSNAVVSLKVVGLAAGVFSSIASGTRGGWIAIPVSFAIWLYFLREKLPKSVRWAAILTLIIVVAAIALSPTSQRRLIQLYEEFADLPINMDSSLGLRLQLWKASWLLFLEHPFTGIGPEQFDRFLPLLSDAGIITQAASEIGLAEIHSEIMMRSAALGLPGLAAILAIHVVPFILFASEIRSAEIHKRRAAVMGICLVASFVLFGLTVEIYNLKMTVTFYSMTLSLLLSVVNARTS